MISKLQLYFFTLLLLICINPVSIMAQTCSVNAGVSSTICVSGTMNLSGNATGALASTAQWGLVSGPNTPTITSPASPATTVTGFIPGIYIFRYYATCSDATAVADSVMVTVSAIPTGFAAGTDTIACGNAYVLNATLPSGTSGLWSYSLPAAPNFANNASFGNATLKNSSLNLTGYGPGCPKSVNAIWTVTQGACTAKDTVTVQFRVQTNYGFTTPDAAICGTSFSTPDFYYYGCGGNVSFAQLAGPTTATITPPATNASYTQGIFTNMSSGTYTFTATSTPACAGSIFRDTFNVTVGSTVAVTNPSVPSKSLCPQLFDSVYYFMPANALLPGETMTWNLNPTNTSTPGSTVMKPVADTIGNILRLRNVAHPDTNATDGSWIYYYSYTVTNGTCSQTYQITLRLVTPMGKKAYLPVVNLPCGATGGNITLPTYGTNVGYTFSNPVMLSTPAGAPAPLITISANIGLIANGLQPGRYRMKFDYYTYSPACDLRTAIVEVNVSTAAGLSNAGTDQIMGCGVDSTTLAGNFPVVGQSGNWQLVSGPSSLILTNPNSASLLVKNLLPGVYTLRWSIASGSTCPASADDINVIVTPTPPVAHAGSDRSVCYGYQTSLNGNAVPIGATGRWRQIGGPAIVIADTTAGTTSFSGSVSGTVYTFTWTLSNACGADTDTVVITTGASQGPSNAVITNPDACISASTIALTATTPVMGTGFWYQLSGPGTATIATPASSRTRISGLIGGEYKFIWRVTATGCDTLQDTISIANRTVALTANAGADRYICKDTINLNATIPALGTGTWTQLGGPGTDIADSHNPVTNVSNLTGGSTYDYLWTVTLGVCSTAIDTVHIGVSAPPSAAIARTDTLICGNTLAVSSTISLPLYATLPAVGTGGWLFIKTPYNGGSVANVSAPVTTASLYGGVTQLVWQVANGACPATMDTVTVEIVPKADAGPVSYSLCEAISQNLQGTQPANGTVSWTQLSGPAPATITKPTSPFTAINNLAAGTYKFRYAVTNSAAPACSSVDTITIINAVMPVANAGRDTVFCYVPSGTVLYLKADTPALGTGAWTRSVGTGSISYNPNANSNPTRATVSVPGLHQFRWTVTNGACQALDYKDVLVEQLTVPAIVFTPTTACQDSFNVAVTSPYNNFDYAWSFQRARIKDTSGLNLTGPISNNFLVSDTNDIYLRITNPITGCSAQDSIPIIVNCSYLPLPLQLLSFGAERKDTRVQLNWLVANERDISLYHMERSTDGQQWSRLGTTYATNAHRYEFIDAQPAKGINLYRLYIQERDQTFSYSPVKIVEMEGPATAILIYPNPANETLHIVLQNESTENRYELVDAMGRLIRSAGLDAKKDNVVTISNLIPGSYVLKVIADQSITTKQLQVLR